MQLDYPLTEAAMGALSADLKPLLAQSEEYLKNPRHGDFPRWKAVVDQLAELPFQITFKEKLAQASVALGEDYPDQAALKNLLLGLQPWRKGPFNLAGVEIDSEWHSDWKWERLEKHLGDLDNQRILDIGCGNGYFGWRMLGAGAKLVIGIDPTLLFVLQYFACRHFAPKRLANVVLPLRIEHLPAGLSGFDSVFSMGVLYHRRSPIEHLQRLRHLSRPGGQVILETLVIEGDINQVLVPEDRYARMRNVWFLPSSTAMCNWMQRAGFKSIECVDETPTTTAEQRSTPWMTHESLAESLDANDHSKTIEGYPAPQRAIFIAKV